MKRKTLIIIILIMTIGFASVSTNLIIKGSNKIIENESDFEIIFTKAILDNIDVYESVISEDKKTITFTSNDLKKLNDASTLNYEVTNNSRNYDAEVTINCNVKENTIAEYTSITNVLNAKNNIIKAKEVVDGNVTITLDKVSVSEVTEEYTCTLEFNAVERTSLGFPIVKLYDYIESNADKNTTINFNINSKTSGTNGIYTTNKTNDGTEVYYYRGNVDNNLIFNNMCWKIIRTTETGGVKLIYNGLPTDGKCNNTGEDTQLEEIVFNENYDDNTYVGYMYGSAGSSTYKATHANMNSSTVKKYVDNWFSKSFDESTQEMLEDTVFCVDRNTVNFDSSLIGGLDSSQKTLGYGKNPTLYGAVIRASWNSKTTEPTLVCKNTNGSVDEFNDSFTVSTENGNGSLTYPVGLITLDEAVYAGFNTYYTNTSDYKDTNNYLYTGSNYLTLTPIVMWSNGNIPFVGRISDEGSIFNHRVYNASGVRPVLSLKSGTKISLSGDGSESSPYIVV